MKFFLSLIAAVSFILIAPITQVAGSSESYAGSPDKCPEDSVCFSPSIYFPGLENLLGDNGRIVVEPDTLAKYIVELYKFLTGATAIIALFMITYGGLLWLLAGGNQGSISQAKEIITGALAGMIIALLSYVLLASISSGLVRFEGLNTTIVIPPVSTQSTQAGTLAADVTCDSPGMVSLDDARVPQNLLQVQITAEGSSPCLNADALDKLIIVGFAMIRDPFPHSRIKVTSALRSRARQAVLFESNCSKPTVNPVNHAIGCKAEYPNDWQQVCTSRDCDPETCNPYGEGKTCPHTEGNAIDIFCSEADRDGLCQAKLMNLMRSNGFCRLDSEAWHFEYPKLSSACN